MPLLGLGTFLSKPGEVGKSVKAALKIGYRHIDCAEAYNNQKEIGEALKEVFSEGHIKREDVFITSKLDNQKMNPLEQIDKQINTTLADLQLSYLDLYLVHQPVIAVPDGKKFKPARGVTIQQVWQKLETFVDAGKVKAIGVSNFPAAMINDMLNYARIKPVINQIERTPYLTHKNHIDFCRSEGIEITAYGPLGAPGGSGAEEEKKEAHTPLLSNPVVTEIAKNHGKSPAQILIRYQIDSKVVVIPKSIKPERLQENFDVFDFQLSSEEMKKLDGLNCNFRYFDQEWHGVPTFK
jgi:diketogulonate reductase-like aldo/keto reductase